VSASVVPLETMAGKVMTGGKRGRPARMRISSYMSGAQRIPSSSFAAAMMKLMRFPKS